MSQSPSELVERLFAEHDAAANRGYSSLMNEAIDILKILIVHTAGYTDNRDTKVPGRRIAAAMSVIEMMLRYAQDGQ